MCQYVGTNLTVCYCIADFCSETLILVLGVIRLIHKYFGAVTMLSCDFDKVKDSSLSTLCCVFYQSELCPVCESKQNSVD